MSEPSKIEDVARALTANMARNMGTSADKLWQETGLRDALLVAARCAIEAMRGPTERMVSAGQMYERANLAEQFDDMLNEALAERPHQSRPAE